MDDYPLARTYKYTPPKNYVARSLEWHVENDKVNNFAKLSGKRFDEEPETGTALEGAQS